MAPLLHPHYQTSRSYGPLRHPVAFDPFPVSAVIGPTCSRRFLSGAYRTSPVSVVSLSPCRRHYPAGVDYPFSQSEIAHAVFADIMSGSTTGILALTRLAQRSLTLQPGHSLISPKLTLSVGSSISITLHAATQARRLLALTAAGLPSSNESHPMDHDSNSSGHANNQSLARRTRRM